MGRQNGWICCVPECNTNSREKQFSLFNIPIDRCEQWLQNIGRQELYKKGPERIRRGYRVCGKHFEDKFFLNDLRNRLQPTAIPTLYIKQALDNSNIDSAQPQVAEEQGTGELESIANSSAAEEPTEELLQVVNSPTAEDDDFIPCDDQISIGSEYMDDFVLEKHNEDTCRLCAASVEDTRYSIFEVKDHSLAEKINFCLPISVSQDDELPFNVCRTCKENLDRTYDFAYKVLQATMFLNEKLANYKEDRNHTDIVDNPKANESSVETLSQSPVIQEVQQEIVKEIIIKPNKASPASPIQPNKATKKNFGPALCHICRNQRFKNEEELRTHQKLHQDNGVIVLACGSCSEVFTPTNSQDIHKEAHEDIFAVEYHLMRNVPKCEYCEKCFVFGNKLMAHKTSEHSDDTFLCEQCDTRFIDNDVFQTHLSKEHANERVQFPESYVCSSCGLSNFKDYTSLATHTCTKHKVPASQKYIRFHPYSKQPGTSSTT